MQVLLRRANTLVRAALLVVAASSASAAPLIGISGDCTSALRRGTGTPVDIAWVAREHDLLRGYRLTVVEQVPGLTPSQCVLDVAPRLDLEGRHQSRMYRLTLSASPDSHFSVSLAVLPEEGSPLFLAERHVLAAPYRLRQDRTAPTRAASSDAFCGPSSGRTTLELGTSRGTPPRCVIARLGSSEDSAYRHRSPETPGPRGPPIRSARISGAG
jgi:hypothetical protein